MTDCKHELIGTANGVYCKKCGLTMTAKEYADLLNMPKEKPVRRKKVKADE